MASKTIDKELALRINDLIRNGVPTADIANLFDVSPAIISVLEHNLAKHGSDGFMRILEIENTNFVMTQQNLELRDYAAKHLAKWLIQGGLMPGQVHICTALTVHQCRHLYQQVRRFFATEESKQQMPQTFMARLIMSIFSNHYLYLQKEFLESNDNTLQLENIVVAWSRTLEEVRQTGIAEMPDFEPALVSLGSLFAVARGLRETREKEGSDEGRRAQKFQRSRCNACGSYYVWFTSARRHKSSKCCFCEMLSASDAKKTFESIDEISMQEALNKQAEADAPKEEFG